jgi:DNA-binding SARP family transcriptional activator/Tfp pilus assembly protein PilF
VPVQFRLLGPVEIHRDGHRLALARRQERCLLAILLLQPNQVVPADRLCALLWDDDPPGPARAVLRSHAARIRALLTRGATAGCRVALDWEHGGYVIRVDPETIDAHRFRQLIAEAGATMDLAVRDRLLAEARSLWRGPALQDAASDRLRQRICADLDEMRLHAIEESLAVGLELGRHRQIAVELAALTSEHPLRERLVELHMLALYRAGRTPDALDAFNRYRERLADRLGLDPTNTLRQLHTAILRAEPVREPTPAAPASTGHTRPAQLPADLAMFAARAEPLRRLDALVGDQVDGESPATVLICAITGTAGVGKTALAVHWAHRVRDRFPDGQLYVNLRGFDPVGTVVTASEAIRRFLDALGVPAARIPAGLDAQADLYRTLLAGKKMLVLLDNARDVDQVRPLLPGAPGCLVLITSRHQLAGLVVGDGAQPLHLDVLSVDEARDLLTRRIGADRVAAEPGAVDRTIASCAQLALALALAAARASMAPQLPLAALAAELSDEPNRLEVLSTGDAGTDLRSVFSSSHQALTPAGARLFRLLGLHPGPDISSHAAASLAGLPRTEVRPLLAELVRANLVEEHTADRYTFHDLLRAYAEEQSRTHETSDERRAAVRRIVDHYLHTARTANRLIHLNRAPVSLAPAHPAVTPEALDDPEQAMSWFTVERPILLATIQQAARAGLDTQVWQLAWTLTTFLDRQGHWLDWVCTQHAAVDAAQRLTDHAMQATAHRYLGGGYERLSRPDDAHAHLRQALDLYGKVADPAGQARTHIDLAILLDRQDRHREAIDHARQAIVLHGVAGHQIGQATALNSLGWNHAMVGEYTEALTWCQQALTLFQNLGNHRGEAATSDSLGYIHHNMGHYEQAVTYYRRALDVYRETGDRYLKADALRHLGETYRAIGDLDAARSAWTEALTILTALDHPDTDKVRTSLGQLD